MVANEDRFKPYFPKTLEQNLTPDLAKRFANLKAKAFASKEEFLFIIKEKGTNTIVGLVYIKELDWTINQGEFAYCIGYPFKGKSIISKATLLLSKYAFETLGLKTLQIITHKDNIASVNVAKYCGYTWQKTLLKEFTPNGGAALDMELYELYNER
jgi:ribosomal-protein-alanine N-acetyltransferase